MPFPATERIGQKIALTARALGLLIRPIGTIMILIPLFRKRQGTRSNGVYFKTGHFSGP